MEDTLNRSKSGGYTVGQLKRLLSNLVISSDFIYRVKIAQIDDEEKLLIL